MNGTERTESIFTLIPSQTFCKEKNMDLKKRGAEMRDFFDRKIDGYDEVHAKFTDTKRLLTENLREGTVSVLDLGGGTGLELIPLFERFPDARVTVADISEKMLEALTRRPFADRIRTVPGDFFETDWGEGYDAVISTSALHHFDPADKLRLYRKVWDCLRDGGQFLNSDKVSANRAEEERDLAEYAEDPERWPHMDTPLAPSTELELLENAGFVRIAVGLTDQENYRLFSAEKPVL